MMREIRFAIGSASWELRVDIGHVTIQLERDAA